MKTFFVTARPVPSVLALPHEAVAIRQAPAITVELQCTSMGRTNQNKLTSLAFNKVKETYQHLGRIGGAGISNPKERAA